VVANDTSIRGQAYNAGDTVQVQDSVMMYDARGPYGTRSWDDFRELGISARGDLFWIVPPELSRHDTVWREGGAVRDLALPKFASGFLASWRSRDYTTSHYTWSGMPARVTQGLDSKDHEIVDQLQDGDSVANYILTDGVQGFRSDPTNYDTYNSGEGGVSLYGKVDVGAKLWNRPTDLHVGGRYELFLFDFTAPYTGQAENFGALKMDTLEHQFYPSLGFDIELFRNTKTRFLWTRTLVRPEVRERAPVLYYDSEDETEVEGNPQLHNTVVHNLDLRFDWFLPFNQLASLSLFRKAFTDPIEVVLDANLSPERRRFQNAESGWSQGVELEFDADLSRWLGWAPTAVREGWRFYINAAFIASEVQIDTNEVGASLLTSKKRAMMGQSPYLWNAKLSNERPLLRGNLLNSLAFNVAGPRIYSLGTNELADIYEQPFPSLDYLTRFSLGRHTFSFTAKNLLVSSVRFTMEEFHQNLDYVSISDAQRDAYYAEVQRKWTVRRVEKGIELGLGYKMSL